MSPEKVAQAIKKALIANASLQFAFSEMQKYRPQVQLALRKDYDIFHQLEEQENSKAVYDSEPWRVIKNSLQLVIKSPDSISGLIFELITTPLYHEIYDFFAHIVRSLKELGKETVLNDIYSSLSTSRLPGLVYLMMQQVPNLNSAVIQQSLQSVKQFSLDKSITAKLRQANPLSARQFDTALTQALNYLESTAKKKILYEAIKLDHNSYRSFRLGALKENVKKKHYKLPGRPSFSDSISMQGKSLSDVVTAGRAAVQSFFSESIENEGQQSLSDVFHATIWGLLSDSWVLPLDYYSFVFSTVELEPRFIFDSLSESDTLKRIVANFDQFPVSNLEYLPDCISQLKQVFSTLERTRSIQFNEKDQFQAFKKYLAIIHVRTQILHFFREKKLGVDSLILPSFLDIQSRKLLVSPLDKMLYGTLLRVNLSKWYTLKMKRATFQALMKEAVETGMIKGDTMRRQR